MDNPPFVVKVGVAELILEAISQIPAVALGKEK